MQRDCCFSHTWLSMCTCVYVCSEATIFPFLLFAKMAHILHLAWGRVRERGRKGRKLPAKVLQCFKNLSSHSAELSHVNNRFGTWPACTRESVTAALWSGFPTFDGCAVSQNSWRRGAPAECMRWRGKKTTKSKRKDFFVSQTHASGLCQSETRHLAAWPVAPYTETNRYLCPTAPLHSQMRTREKVHHMQCNPRWRSSKSSLPVGLSSGFTTSCSSQRHFSSGRPPPRAPPGMACHGSTNSLEEWVGGTASPSLSASQHIKEPYCTPKADWMHLGQLFIPPWDACVGFWGICGWKD